MGLISCRPRLREMIPPAMAQTIMADQKRSREEKWMEVSTLALTLAINAFTASGLSSK
ncbi:hypothetical protein D3C86_1765980 [compost metagenome]